MAASCLAAAHGHFFAVFAQPGPALLITGQWGGVNTAYHRRQAVARVALRGALGLIAQAGVGEVVGYPRDTRAERASKKPVSAGDLCQQA